MLFERVSVRTAGGWSAAVATAGGTAGPPGWEAGGELLPVGAPVPSVGFTSTPSPSGRPCWPSRFSPRPRSSGNVSRLDEGAGLAGGFAGACGRGVDGWVAGRADRGDAERNRGAASRLAAPRLLAGRSKRTPA